MLKNLLIKKFSQVIRMHVKIAITSLKDFDNSEESKEKIVDYVLSLLNLPLPLLLIRPIVLPIIERLIHIAIDQVINKTRLITQ